MANVTEQNRQLYLKLVEITGKMDAEQWLNKMLDMRIRLCNRSPKYNQQLKGLE